MPRDEAAAVFERPRRPQTQALADTLNFDGPNNQCLSLRILAERVRTGETQIIFSGLKENGVLEVKVMGEFRSA